MLDEATRKTAYGRALEDARSAALPPQTAFQRAMEDAREASRRRARDTIARVDELLAQPRPEGEPWRLAEPQPQLSGPEPALVRKTAPAAAVARPQAAGATKTEMRRYMDALEQAIGQALGIQERAASWRFTELERRCEALERRLETLETKAGGGDA